MRKIKNPNDVLKEVYGFDSFRPSQEDIVKSVLEGKDGLAVLTTGGGKSLCYQVPALSCKGTTLVISPLISLMKDQVDALTKNGVSAGYINSSLTMEESTVIMSKLRAGNYNLFYIAPERLASPDFIDALKQVEIPFVAIDEAHCISTWGHDFRISYQKISESIDILGEHHGKRIPRFAYTATATPEIREDIVNQLDMIDPYVYVGKFDRPNIEFNVINSTNKVTDIINLLRQKSNEPTIIYTATIKAGTSLVERLQGMEFNVGFYHGRLDSKVKEDTQNDFLNNKIDIMVATNAFGMGIDKPDVKNVIHFHMPADIENYYQEAGRAGRDGNDSNAYLFFNNKDRGLQEFFIDMTFPSVDVIRGVQKIFAGLKLTEPFNISHEQIVNFSPDHIKGNQVSSILRILEEQGAIKLHAIEMSSDHSCIEPLDITKDLDLDYLTERKKVVNNNLSSMERFCLTKLCRRRYLLRHFGEKVSHKNCGSCDICMTHTKENERAVATVSSSAVKSIMNLIKDTKERFDEKRLTDILLGVNNPTLKRRGIDQLKSFGSLKDWSRADVIDAISRINEEGFIIPLKKDKGIISLTDKGNNALAGKENIIIEAKNKTSPSTVFTPGSEDDEKKVISIEDTFDSELYKKLDLLRRSISGKINKPIFMIYSDDLMKEIATKAPVNLSDLENLGLSPGKVKLFGSDVIKMIDRHYRPNIEENNFVM